VLYTYYAFSEEILVERNLTRLETNAVSVIQTTLLVLMGFVSKSSCHHGNVPSSWHVFCFCLTLRFIIKLIGWTQILYYFYSSDLVILLFRHHCNKTGRSLADTWPHSPILVVPVVQDPIWFGLYCPCVMWNDLCFELPLQH